MTSDNIFNKNNRNKKRDTIPIHCNAFIDDVNKFDGNINNRVDYQRHGKSASVLVVFCCCSGTVFS